MSEQVKDEKQQSEEAVESFRFPSTRTWITCTLKQLRIQFRLFMSSDVIGRKREEMYHQQQQNHQRQLFLQGGNGISDTGLILSTDAKPRLKWTPELHQRFIEAVNQLGGPDKATPKTIMKLMGVPGLTLYHLKSHLQKYRLSKNLQGQVNTGINKIGCTTVVAEDRISEVTGALVSNTNLGSQANKSMQINEAIQMQIEVQRRLHEQLEVQRHLQLRIEAQGKYLQSVLEKAQETIGRQNLCSTGLDAAKLQLTELVSKVSNECLNSALSLLKESPGLCNQRTQTNQPTDCSIDSCLTTCEGSQKDQEMQNSGMGLRPHHGNGPLAQKETREFRLEQTEFPWCEDLNENKTLPSPMERNLEIMMFPVKGSSSDLSMSIRVQGEKRSSGRCISEARLKERDADDNFLDDSNCRKPAFPPETENKSTGLELSYATAKLDLNDQDKDDIDSSCKQFDLNGFSWSLEGSL